MSHPEFCQKSFMIQSDSLMCVISKMFLLFLRKCVFAEPDFRYRVISRFVFFSTVSSV